MRKHCIAFTTAGGVLLAGVAALAITYGSPDGNGHPNVGALVAEWRTAGQKDLLCSGTLISPTVFLTAAHCTSFLESEMKAGGTLFGRQFTAVGYGVHEPTLGGGPPGFPDTNDRWVAVSEFNALNNAWLRLSQNDATGDGGTCYGDSGGPNFLGAGVDETDIVAAITVTGDAMCLATNDTYRLDTPSARAFIGAFVQLP